MEATQSSPHRIGVAFIVSNDYSTNQSGLHVLNGTHRDAEKMSESFSKLGYEVVPRRDMSRPDLIDFVGKAAAWPCHPSYKRLVFVFSGHGNCNGVIYSQEGGVVNVEDIINQFKPDKQLHLGKMARLFFFDACRGDAVDPGVVIPKGGGFLTSDRVPTHSNILVAYSTLPNHKSFEVDTGGLWTDLLAKAIQTQNDEITTVLTEVSRQLTEICKSLPVFMTPQCISQLTDHVNFFAEMPSSGNGLQVILLTRICILIISICNVC